MSRSRRPILVALLASWPAAAGAQDPNGPQFAVNTHTTGTQLYADVAVDGSGHFVVAWVGAGAGDTFGVFARRFNSAGVPRGAEFRVNTYTTGAQDYGVAVGSDRFGNFLVTWVSDGQDGSGTGVFGQRYDAAGAPVGGEFRVNTYTTGGQISSHVALDDAGNFVVVWTEYPGRDGLAPTVLGRRYDATTGFGPEFRVNAFTLGTTLNPRIAMTAVGAFVVAWAGGAAGDYSVGILARRFDAAGNGLGGDFLVNTYTTGGQLWPAVGVAADGSFVVAWDDYPSASPFARRYDAAGNPLGVAFAVSEYTTGDGARPRVAVDPDGSFVVAWWNYPSSGDGSGYGVSARGFDGAGTPVGGDIRVNTYTTGTQFHPSVDAGPAGQFVAAWQGRAAHDTVGISGQRYGDLVFGDSFESGGLDAWSASQADGGDLSVTAAAGMAGSPLGLQALVDDTAGLFVQDDTPADGRRYRARFYFDPNGFDPGVAQNHLRTRVFIGFEEAPNRRLFAVVLRLLSGQYALMSRVRRDDNTQANSSFVNIADAPHFVELEWVSATGPDALDGSFAWWIDGNPAPGLSGVDNSISGLDFVRLGALSVKTGASGVLRWDHFQSRRETPIGP